MAWNDDIISEFDASLDKLVVNFESSLNSLISSLSADIRAVTGEPRLLRDVVNRSSSALSVGLGDAKTGIYGEFYNGIDAIIKVASDDIQSASTTTVFTTQYQVDAFQDAATAISDHISSSVESAGTKIGDIVTLKSDQFSSDVASVQNESSRIYVTSAVDSCLASIKRAELKSIESFDRLFSILTQYKSVPLGIYDDTNAIVSDIYNAYNDGINSSIKSFNSAISAYDMYTESSSVELTSGNSRIDVAVNASYKLVAAKAAKLGEILKSISPQVDHLIVDYVVSRKVFQCIDDSFTESIKIRNLVDSVIRDISSDAEIILKSLEKYFVSSYVPIFVDGDSYRSSRQRVVSGAYELLRSSVVSLGEKYSSKISVLSNNFSTYVDQLQSGLISYINDKLPSIPPEQIELISSHFTKSMSGMSSRVSSYFDLSNSRFNYITSSLSSHLTRLVDKYYAHLPLIRYTGYIESTPVINNGDYNKFSFDVENIGGTPWVGWFGVRITSSSIDDDDDSTTGYTPPYFVWNKRFKLYSILPNQVRHVVVSVPGPQIFNFDELLGGIYWSVIVNTHNGVNRSWLKQ